MLARLAALEGRSGQVAKSAGKSDVERVLEQVNEHLKSLPYTRRVICYDTGSGGFSSCYGSGPA